MNTPEKNFLDVSCPKCGAVPQHGHFCNDMNTQNTPKAVQSEVEIVNEFREKFDDQTEFGTFEMCAWLLEKLTTYQHRIEEARGSAISDVLNEIKDCNCKSCRALEARIANILTPKEPNDTEI